MNDEVLTDQPKSRRLGLKIALVSAGIAAGAIGATAIGASAQSTTTAGTPVASVSSSSTSSGTNGTNMPQDSGRARGNEHGSSPVRSDEKSVSSADAATLKAAAVAAVPGGTVYRVETDAGDGTYEAHMTKADSTEVTVKFDKSLKVTKVETGMGTGDPAPSGHPGDGH